LGWRYHPHSQPWAVAVAARPTEGQALQFTGGPSFAPERLQTVRVGAPMKAKHLEKALM
jgi:peptide subunit release factor RF-3